MVRVFKFVDWDAGEKIEIDNPKEFIMNHLNDNNIQRYGLAEIESMNRDAMRKAKRLGVVPFLISSEEQISGMPPFPFPNIGGLKPKGWVKVQTFFVDSSGLGASDELALSVDGFKKKLKVGRGYAITSEGQFQV